MPERRAAEGVFSKDGGKTWGYVLSLGPQLNGYCPSCRRTYWISATSRQFCSKCGGALTIGTSPRERRVAPSHRTKNAALRERRAAQLTSSTNGRGIARRTLAHFLMCEWLPQVESDIEPTTWLSLKTQIERHIVPGIGHVRVKDLTRDHIRALYSELLQKPKGSGGATLSRTTVQGVHKCLHWALESLVTAGELPANPSDGAKPRTRKSDMYEIHTWTPEQLDAFLTFARSDMLFPIWRLLAWTGLRRGEALGLQWRDLQLNAGILSVRRAVCAAGSRVYVSRPKSSVARVVELDRETIRVLRAHCRRQQRAQSDHLHDCWVFADEAGDHLHPTRVSKRFASLVDASDLPRIRLHDLRHTHASHLIMSGANIKVVQERLGHANTNITLMTYTHLMPTTQRTAIDVLAKQSHVHHQR